MSNEIFSDTYYDGRYLAHEEIIETTTPEGFVTPETLLLLTHSRFAHKHHYDSRVLYDFMHNHMKMTLKQSHKDWISFAKKARLMRDGLAFVNAWDLRIAPNSDEFIMLTWLQSSVFVMRELVPSDISCDEIDGLLFDFAILHRRQQDDFEVILMTTVLHGRNGKTCEEIIEDWNSRNDKSPIVGPEKKIEEALGAQLRQSGKEVRHQVYCEYGVADIVTPDAIYEVKAKLTRKELHYAIAQVLLYQVCINPEASLYIVGCKPKKEAVAVELAHARGIEVIIWEDAKDGGAVADLESQGLKVVSDQNYLDTTKRKRIKEKRQKDDVQPQLFLQLEEGQE